MFSAARATGLNRPAARLQHRSHHVAPTSSYAPSDAVSAAAAISNLKRSADAMLAQQESIKQNEAVWKDKFRTQEQLCLDLHDQLTRARRENAELRSKLEEDDKHYGYVQQRMEMISCMQTDMQNSLKSLSVSVASGDSFQTAMERKMASYMTSMKGVVAECEQARDSLDKKSQELDAGLGRERVLESRLTEKLKLLESRDETIARQAAELSNRASSLQRAQSEIAQLHAAADAQARMIEEFKSEVARHEAAIAQHVASVRALEAAAQQRDAEHARAMSAVARELESALSVQRQLQEDVQTGAAVVKKLQADLVESGRSRDELATELKHALADIERKAEQARTLTQEKQRLLSAMKGLEADAEQWRDKAARENKAFTLTSERLEDLNKAHKEAHLRLDELTSRMADETAALNAANAALSEAQRASRLLDDQIERQQAELDAAKQSLEKMKGDSGIQLQEAQQELEAVKAALAAADQRAAAAQTELEQLTGANAALMQDKTALEKQLEEQAAAALAAQTQAAAVDAASKEALATQEAKFARDMEKRMRGIEDDAARHMAGFRTQLDERGKSLEELQAANKTLQDELEASKRHASEAADAALKQLEALKAEFSDSKAAADAATAQAAELQADLEQRLQQAEKELSEQLAAARRNHAELLAKEKDAAAAEAAAVKAAHDQEVLKLQKDAARQTAGLRKAHDEQLSQLEREVATRSEQERIAHENQVKRLEDECKALKEAAYEAAEQAAAERNVIEAGLRKAQEALQGMTSKRSPLNAESVQMDRQASRGALLPAARAATPVHGRGHIHSQLAAQDTQDPPGAASSGRKKRRTNKAVYRNETSEDENWNGCKPIAPSNARGMRPPTSRVPARSRGGGRMMAMSAASGQSDGETECTVMNARIAHAAVGRRGTTSRVRSQAPDYQQPAVKNVRAHDIFGLEMDPYVESDGLALDDM